MNMEFSYIIIYVACFAGLFVSIFYVLTIFSPNKTKKFTEIKKYPLVSIIIPVWNEGSANGERLRKTLNSVFAADYPQEKIDLIIVDDGSTDNSLKIAKDYESKGVRVFSHPVSRGKTNAVNTGMTYAKGEFVAALDADSFIMPDVIRKLIPCFDNPNVMAAIPSIKIWKPRTILQRIQSNEFLSAVFIRHLQSELGAIHLAPGAFTLIRRKFLKKYGSLNANTMVEDLEISFRIQSHNYLIDCVIDANVYTSGVRTWKAFVNQRLRWFCGFIKQIIKYKHLFGPKHGNLGVFVLPTSIFFILFMLFLFFYALIKFSFDTFTYIQDLILTGINLDELLHFKFDVFFVTIGNHTIIPILLLIMAIAFILYIKNASNEKQGVILNFLLFTLTYWFLAAYCWTKAIYYHFAKKKIKWGPNYFSA